MSTDFWTRSSQYGLVHKAAAPPANPEALVVFVHGVFGNCRRTWGHMPQWVLEAAGLDLVAGLVGRYGSDSALPVVERTLARVAEVNRVTGTSTLIRRVAGEAGAAGRSEIRRDPNARVAPRLLLPGPAGSRHPLPGVPPPPAGHPAAGGTGLRATLGCALGLVDGAGRPPLTGEPRVRCRLAGGRLPHPAVTVILDGVDDFLVNHPTMGLSYVVDTLRGAVGRYRDNPVFAVVASVRSGLHGLERLAGEPRDVVEVLRLSVAQADQTFPTCRRTSPESWRGVSRSGRPGPVLATMGRVADSGCGNVPGA